ncbi:MAG: DUF4382 domain-containing protein [bacterium]
MSLTMKLVPRARRRWGKRGVAAVIGAAALAWIAGGCSEDQPGTTGTLVVRVADTPYPFDLIASAEVTIDRVEAHVLSADHKESAFYVLSEEPRTMNLLDLRGGVTELLVQSEVPIGRLDEIRLHVVSATVTLEDGRRFDLDVPSGMQSGLKVFCSPPVDVAGDLTTELLLDFDVSQSFEAVPASVRRVADVRQFKLHPVARLANLSETGTLSGHVRGDGGTPVDVTDDGPLADATVEVAGGGDAWWTSTDASGEWRIMGLPPGGYVVSASGAGYDGSQRAANVVVANDVSAVDFLLHRAGG